MLSVYYFWCFLSDFPNLTIARYMEDPGDPANPVSSPVCHGHSKFLCQNPCLVWKFITGFGLHLPGWSFMGPSYLGDRLAGSFWLPFVAVVTGLY